MKINVGCGEDIRDGYVNVDVRPGCGADVVADVRHLPFPSGSADELLALDICEHFSAVETHDLLTEWHRVLKDRGRLIVRVPNLHALAVQIAYWHDKPGPQLTAFIQNIHGAHRWGGDTDVHHTGFSPASLDVVLRECGFEVLSNDCALNMTVEAVKVR